MTIDLRKEHAEALEHIAQRVREVGEALWGGGAGFEDLEGGGMQGALFFGRCGDWFEGVCGCGI